MSPEKMVMMANQIATFFKTQPTDTPEDLVAAHINDFWAPEMRAELASYAANGGEGLDTVVIAAVKELRLPEHS